MTSATELLSAAGFDNADSIVKAAADSGLPLGVAVALIAKESMGTNVYGHDVGGYRPGDIVTQANFAQFYQAVVVDKNTSNGVGPCQITYPGYFSQNPNYAWWDPYSNMLFGFNLLKGYLNGVYTDSALVAAGSTYNSGSATGSASTYGRTFADLAETWTDRLSSVDSSEDDMDANQAQMLKEIHDRVLGGIPGGAEVNNGAKILDSVDGSNLLSAIQDVPKNIMNYTIARQGWEPDELKDIFSSPNTSLGAIIAWNDKNINNIVVTIVNQIKGLVGTVSSDELTDAIKQSLTTALVAVSKNL